MTVSNPRSDKNETSIDAKKVNTVVEEIKSIGGEAIGVPHQEIEDKMGKH